MKTAIKLLPAVLALALTSTACNSGKQENSPSSPVSVTSGSSHAETPEQAEQTAAPTDAYIPFSQRLEAMRGQNWAGLTADQMLEDWDLFYQNLKENYPYFGVVARIADMDMEARYKEIRAQIPSYTSDMDFYIALNDYIEQTENAGHLSLRWPEPSAETGERYEALYRLINPVLEQALSEYNAKEGANTDEPNVSTEIIDAGKVAYVKINSFDMEQYDTDKVKLMDFYKGISEYDNLIIDISQNGGGGMGYYFDLILDPLLQEPVEHYFYTFMKDGALNRSHFQQAGGTAEMYPLTTTPADLAVKMRDELAGQITQDGLDQICRKLESLPWPPAEMNMNDFADFDQYNIGIWNWEPEDRLFNGKIWVLVSGNVYSSSESFALFCKSTGFATLVGTQTGGDGIGTDPVVFSLPNSGIYVRYAPMYGTTLDGRSSEEFGTTPDIISPEGQSPLDTCLEAISQSN